jgi:gamma-glutamylcyclotransferase (GGCT)/AIG2-like uncharacterized protein YtfP
VTFVFAYGSNTHEKRINSPDRLKGDARYLYNARTVDDYELDFTVWSKNNNCAAADIVLKEGSNVWGVVYDVPSYLICRGSANRLGRKSLDEIEGEDKNYQRIRIKVETEAGKIIEAITYEVINKRKGLKTSREYAEHIIKGLEEHNIPWDYINKVKRKIIENNPCLCLYFES